MNSGLYEPGMENVVACDDGMHYILLDQNASHFGWVMRRHPDGLLVSVRKATDQEMAHARARQHLRRGAAMLAAPQPPAGEEPEVLAWIQPWKGLEWRVDRMRVAPGTELIDRTHFTALQARLQAAEARAVALEKDAARYRHIRDVMPHDDLGRAVLTVEDGQEYDRAIDAALAKHGGHS